MAPKMKRKPNTPEFTGVPVPKAKSIRETPCDEDDGNGPAKKKIRGRTLTVSKPLATFAKRLRKVVYASDCSGLDGGAVALKEVLGGTGFGHWFGSEICPKARRVFCAWHPKCEVLYQDLTKRDVDDMKNLFQRDVKETCFIYTAGFPCQPFAKCGLRRGEADSRAQVIWHILYTVEELLPDVVLLENVSDLVEFPRYKAHWDEILRLLRGIHNHIYNVEFKILDSWWYGRVPASRRRVYLVATRRDTCGSWQWPAQLPGVPLDSILEADLPEVDLAKLSKTALAAINAAFNEIRKKYPQSQPFKEPWVVDAGASVQFLNYKYDCLPCVIKSHAGTLWLMHKGRFLSVKELLRSQGIDLHAKGHSHLQWPIPGVTDPMMRQLLGNGFTVTVIARILRSVLPACAVHVS